MLQQGDHLGVHEVHFAFTTPGILGAAIKVAVGIDLLGKGDPVAHQALSGNLMQPGAADAAGCAREILVGEFLVQADDFKDLGAAVAL